MSGRCDFYLGTHLPSWLPDASYPLFIAYRHLAYRRTWPQAAYRWALDSGGFTELQRHGAWTVSARTYARRVRRIADEVGRLDWAAPQDWMCEPAIISGGTYGKAQFAGTHLSVPVHQRLTVENYLELRSLDADLPFVPVLQGYRLPDYLACADMYYQAGIALDQMPRVGLGSVCRRSSTGEISYIAASLAAEGFRLHGFGVKTVGLSKYAHELVSADSLSWSMRGRHVDGCGPSHKTEANCRRFAEHWRSRVLARIPATSQQQLPFGREVA